MPTRASNLVLAVVLLALGFCAVFTVTAAQHTREAVTWLLHTEEVMTAINLCKAKLNRGRFDELNECVANLKALTQDNDSQQQRVTQIEGMDARTDPDGVRASLDNMMAEERRLYIARENRYQDVSHWESIIVIIALTVAGTTLVANHFYRG